MLQEVSRDRISGHLQALRAYQVVRNTVDGRTVEGVLDRGVYREVYGAGARSVLCRESVSEEYPRSSSILLGRSCVQPEGASRQETETSCRGVYP